jgi:hypothetical protein
MHLNTRTHVLAIFIHTVKGQFPGTKKKSRKVEVDGDEKEENEQTE